MYKVLLVDDEPFITEGLSDAVDWSAFGLEVVGSAEDGEEALERLRETGADLLITDISMPIMTGLELIREARALLPQLKVIILSGFNEFDYLKEGMRLGIENYLLKPIRFEELEATLTDTVRKLNADKPMPAFGQDEIEILRDNVMTRWANGRIAPLELAERTALLGIDLSKPFAALAIIGSREEAGNDASPSAFSSLSLSSSSSLASSAEADRNPAAELRDEAGLSFVQFHNEEGELVVACCCIEGGLQDQAKVTKALERLADSWESRCGSPLRIAAGDLLPTADAARSYERARRAQQFFLLQPDRRLIAYAEIAAESAAIPEGLFEWEAYANSIAEKDKDELLRRIERDFAAIRTSEGLNPSRAKGAAVELIILMKMEVDKLGRADAADVFKNILDQAVAAQTLEAVEYAVKAAALVMAGLFAGEDMSPVIKQALRYIREHYAEALTLKSLGHEFHIHPNYLGQLFHKQTGDTFTDYLNKYRIDKAKELLADSRLKVSEIARQVGYWETGYFYKQFKKHVGMAPGDFKELL
ncbi:response regulator transcription factor [Paenibacillus rhizovicinus]|uniref:Response regulator transcription factor n=1 Tax=Paenibacillus rhizovicinus TaxID=2704463 RepID=A0A6C0P0X6_9BACL|nr:response regulator transcription factor [Paenibacillus rhizovicinus]QHW31876.1 response regulator transcription factor [Paenibacillus rhizovicinus]